MLARPPPPTRRPCPSPPTPSARARSSTSVTPEPWPRSPAAIPDIPEEGARGYRRIHQFHEVWRTAALRLMENSFDNAHFAFVHKNTFGDIAQPRPEKYEIVETDFFDLEYLADVRTTGLQKPYHLDLVLRGIEVRLHGIRSGRHLAECKRSREDLDENNVH